MFTINKDLCNEIIINKSKFIVFIYKVNNLDDVNNRLNELKKIYKDATHICYAYIVNNNKKYNDDKEPAGTAGLPILDVLESKKLTNILAVVVRYFGGVKLGAGGLLRAYSNSISDTIKDDDIIELKKEYKIRIEFDYSNVNNINYLLKDYKVTYKEFDKNVVYEFIYYEDEYPNKLDNYIIKKELLK